MPHRSWNQWSATSSGRRIGILSTYPPKLCGLATFTAALEAEFVRAGDTVTIVAIRDGRPGGLHAQHAPQTSHVLTNGSAASVRETVAVLSQSDVAIVQHEYGIYGGRDGDEVIDVLRALRVPAIVVLHTVLLAPTAHQRAVLEAVCDRAAQVVVMTAAAGSRLTAGYTVDPDKVVMIPHGAATAPERDAAFDDVQEPPQLLTWGLLGPGKGIEHVIRALALLRDLRPLIRYTVAGATHPNVLARDGDRYRHSLIRLAESLGVGGSVEFDDVYRGVSALTRFVASAALVVLPYDSRDQVTSGVLVDAIAAGRPVIATAFPHAIELLSDGAGIVVPHADPSALAAAIRRALTDQDLLVSMATRARAIAPSLRWTAVAEQYRVLSDELAPTETALAI